MLVPSTHTGLLITIDTHVNIYLQLLTISFILCAVHSVIYTVVSLQFIFVVLIMEECLMRGMSPLSMEKVRAVHYDVYKLFTVLSSGLVFAMQY